MPKPEKLQKAGKSKNAQHNTGDHLLLGPSEEDNQAPKYLIQDSRPIVVEPVLSRTRVELAEKLKRGDDC
jgi:hypothetical protein